MARDGGSFYDGFSFTIGGSKVGSDIRIEGDRELRERVERELRNYEDRARRFEAENAALKQFVEGLNAQPCSYVTVIGKGCAADRWLVRRGAETLEVQGPKGMVVVPGNTVRVLTQTMNILSVVEAPPAGGELVEVSSVVDTDSCEVVLGAGARVVLSGGRKVDVGDRVVVDASGTVIVKNLGPAKSAQVVTSDTGVTWDDIGGQELAKKAMQEAIEGPVRHHETYQRYGRRPTKGVLLFGPPGNGKTMIGKAAATALAALHGASAKSGFLYVKGPELLSMYVGAAEQGVRQLFDSARRHKAKNGYPAVIFLDEAEALLGKRGMPGAILSSTIVPMFLAEMDGLVDSGAMVLLATNRPDVLDPAVVREGRIDRKVLVGRPSKDDALEIFEKHLYARPLHHGVERTELAKAAVEQLYDAKHAVYRVHRSEGLPKTVTLGHLTSGAQIAAIVDAAASFAIDRELAGDAPGIAASDVDSAVVRSLDEQRHIDHVDELALFCEPFKLTVTRVERVRERISPEN